MKADEPLNNGSFLQMSLGEINPSSSELSHTSSVVNEVGSDTVLNPSDQVEGSVSIKDILHVLPSPATSVSTVSPVQHGSTSFPNLPITLNVSTEAESEVNLAQSSDNTSLPASPAVTSRPVTNKTENDKKNAIIYLLFRDNN